MKAWHVGLIISCFMIGSFASRLIIRACNNLVDNTLHHACGECDHVGECGDYECRPGVDGWQLKEGAR